MRILLVQHQDDVALFHLALIAHDLIFIRFANANPLGALGIHALQEGKQADQTTQ